MINILRKPISQQKEAHLLMESVYTFLIGIYKNCYHAIQKER